MGATGRAVKALAQLGPVRFNLQALNPDLPQQVEAVIRAKKLFRDGQKILVAVSGGLDSMALLALLHRLAAAHRWQLTVAHFNHQLRGKASEADEQLVRRQARALGWPVAVGRGAVKTLARRRGVSLEMAARELRQAFLARAARQRGIATVATAHHADDQVELFFLRVLRGAGSAGLAGMQWASWPVDQSITFVRPLLSHAKSDLAEFARAHGVPFSEDASNASLDILRNRVRHELLPLLRARYQPALDRCVLREMELARAEGDLISELASRWFARARRKPLDRLPIAVQRRVIREQLYQLGQPVDFELVESLRTRPDHPLAARPGRCLIMAANGMVRLQKMEMKMGFDTGCLRLNLKRGRGTAHFGQVKVCWQLADKPGMKCARRPNAEYFDADKVGGQICLRHWQAGDRFHLIGAAAAAKLQDIFTNLKVPRTERRRRLLAATAHGEIFWVEGLRIGEGFKLDKRTVRRLNWRWQRAGG